MARPKVAFLMVGVTRPDAATVYENIISNISYFSTSQPFDADFYRTTYESAESLELRKKCRERGLDLRFNPHLEEGEFRFQTPYPNTYRMFDSIEKCLAAVGDTSRYSCIVRLRIDIRAHQLAVLGKPETGKYYAMPYDDGVVDNIGFSRPDIFTQIWSLDRLKEFQGQLKPERALAAIINSLGVSVERIPFDFTLYQSNDETVLDVPQWSRRNRRFTSDGKTVSSDFRPIKPPRPLLTRIRKDLLSVRKWRNRINRGTAIVVGYSNALIGKLLSRR